MADSAGDTLEPTWYPFADGRTIRTKGSENGVILRDEEHARGSRITLERDTAIAPFAITCGIYGSMFHTAFASTENEAVEKYEAMKRGLDDMLNEDLPEAEYLYKLGKFVDEF